MDGLRPYKYITTLQAKSAKELDNLISGIAMPCLIVGLYVDNKGIHYAKINLSRPLYKKVESKSPKNTNKNTI
jgi:hypothetical protein